MDCNIKSEMEVQIPDELFQNIVQSKCETVEEMSLAYSYCLFNSFLTKYGLYYPDSDSDLVTNKDILSWLGYKKYSSQSKIIKRGGYLEEANIIKHIKEIPLGMINNFIKENQKTIGGVLTASSLLGDDTVKYHIGLGSQKFRNYTVAYPIYLECREGYANGTLIEYINTHKIVFSSIEKIIKRNKANTRNIRTEIYVYGLLKMIARGRQDFPISGNTVEALNLISQSTFSKYVALLEKHKLISIKRGKKSDEFRSTNVYRFLDK